MLGTKARQFIPVPAACLDELVPADHFYRHLEQVLDLTFVRPLVQDAFAANGLIRPTSWRWSAPSTGSSWSPRRSGQH